MAITLLKEKIINYWTEKEKQQPVMSQINKITENHLNDQERKNAKSGVILNRWNSVKMLAFLKYVCQQESLFIVITENKSPEIRKW